MPAARSRPACDAGCSRCSCRGSARAAEQRARCVTARAAGALRPPQDAGLQPGACREEAHGRAAGSGAPRRRHAAAVPYGRP